MRANVFHGVGKFGIEKAPRPHAGIGEAVILPDEQVVLLSDIASTGFSGAESAPVRIGDAAFSLDQIREAYDLFGARREGVLKVLRRP